MPQTSEAEAFLARILQLPPPGSTSFDAVSDALQPSLDDEAELRRLFATDKTNVRLEDIHVGLVDIFDAPQDIRITRARVPKDEDDLTVKHVMPLSEGRRRQAGSPAMVESLDEFKKNWAVFTEGSLSQLPDWSNIVAAGGSVQACLNPLPASATAARRELRKHFHKNAYRTSDVDLFLYGLTPAQAEAKIVAIYDAVRNSVPWDVTCVRTKHTVSIHSQYPYRALQIVLRLYASPAEILAGFDVDAPCCAYDGQRVWASPRAIVAMMRQCNTVDVTRRSPSYEVRLAKYSLRDFEVYVPTLRRQDIDPTIFERAISRVGGLARLLVLEKLMDAAMRKRYLSDRRRLRGRPPPDSRVRKTYKGDLKADADFGVLEMNNYDVVSLHIPYGAGWDARRVEKLIYQTDLGMNSPFNAKNKGRRLHRHPAFFGTIQECLEDCCEYCVEPETDKEKALQEKEDKAYIRGRVEFIQEDPGRQSISGSFNPIDAGEWAEHAYMGTAEKLFVAIVTNDRAAVSGIISQEGFDIDRRDHVGRTPLQIAIMSKAVDIACDLISAGARMTLRVVDGRTALHLAAQLDLPVVARKLLERSAVNVEKAKEAEAARVKETQGEAKDPQMDGNPDTEGAMEIIDAEGVDVDKTDGNGAGDDDDEGEDEHNGGEDDWASEKGSSDKQQKKLSDGIPVDDKDQPDVFDVNAPDWDNVLTPLQYAIIHGSTAVVDELITAGADVTLVTRDGYRRPYLHQLTATILTDDEAVACQIAQKLVLAGAVSSEADNTFFTIFHRIVCSQRPSLVSALLRSDKNAKVIIDTPFIPAVSGLTIFPVVSAIAKQDYATLAVLLAYDVNLVTEADFNRARYQSSNGMRHHSDGVWHRNVAMPIETAIANYDDVVDLLVAVGAAADIPTLEAAPSFNVLGWVRWAYRVATVYLERSGPDDPKWLALTTQPANPSVFPGSLKMAPPLHAQMLMKIQELQNENEDDENTDEMNIAPMQNYYSTGEHRLKKMAPVWMPAIKEYLSNTDKVLTSHGAKAQDKPIGPVPLFNPALASSDHAGSSLSYICLHGAYYSHAAPPHLTSLYNDLFEACKNGDNATIQRLCLPKDAKATDFPLQITTEFGKMRMTCNTLSLALQGRHWDTARLILAIAAAQYRPEQSSAAIFETRNIVLDDEDVEDVGEDDDKDTEPQALNFAKHRSIVHSTASPIHFLQRVTVEWLGKDEKSKCSGSVLKKAVLEDDFEAFVQILDLYETLAEPHPVDEAASLWICEHDRPAMLDELIRRTGLGISIEEPSSPTDEHDEAAQPKKSQTYLGLNVHGKKRKDLALKNDPNAVQIRRRAIPPMWIAATEGAIGVLKYLAGDGPLTAFQYYAATHSDRRARSFRHVSDFAAVLPEWLGWTLNRMNESPLTAAVAGNKFEVLKMLLAFQRPELQDALSVRVNYLDFTLFHVLASAFDCSTEMFDFLLTKGVSVTELDYRGWNIIHWFCKISEVDVLEHALRSLPEDVVETMLKQQSKEVLSTPLHVAVRANDLPGVRILVSTKQQPFLLRDATGSTVLHLAVKKKLPEMTKLLTDACPTELLYMEDAGGNTPLEIAVQNILRAKLNPELTENPANPPVLKTQFGLLDSVATRRPFILAHQEREIPRLRATLQALLAEGRLRPGTKVTTALLAFADKMEAKLAVEKAKAAARAANAKPAKTRWLDVEDAIKTLENLRQAISARPGAQARYPLHLTDMHQSVRSSLEKSQSSSDTPTLESWAAKEFGMEELADPKRSYVDKEQSLGKLSHLYPTVAHEAFEKEEI